MSFKIENGFINKDNKLSGIISIDNDKITYDMTDSNEKKIDNPSNDTRQAKFTQEFLYNYNCSKPETNGFEINNGTISADRKLSGEIIYNAQEYTIVNGKISKKPFSKDKTLGRDLLSQLGIN